MRETGRIKALLGEIIQSMRGLPSGDVRDVHQNPRGIFPRATACIAEGVWRSESPPHTMISSSLLSAQDSGEPMFCDKPEAGKNHMIPYQDTCIRFMKTAEPFSYKPPMNPVQDFGHKL